jgi:5-formyltetrahydrofolate cyclo-ligase
MKQLRQHCRQQRNHLSQQVQVVHAQQATHLFLRSPWAQRPSKIALFLSVDAELSTEKLIHALWKRRFKIYLPVLNTVRGRTMAFAPYHPNSDLKPNKFGILEPQTPHYQHATGQQLDLVIMPLTCFDLSGNRMGMGGGYYDRTFAFKRLQHKIPPKLIGWAHACQFQPNIKAEPWDISLNALVTEQQIFKF